MAVEAIINHRDPTTRFPRLHDVEPGSRVASYFNGTRAPNQDGVPGGEAAIDYATRLAGPMSIWQRGHMSMFGGGFGAGGFCEAHADVDDALGFGTGPFGVGGFGCGGGWFDWKFPFPLRDGVYRVAMRLLDYLGNEEETPADECVLMVQALPRPATNLQAEYAGGNIDLTWTHSPEFQPVA